MTIGVYSGMYLSRTCMLNSLLSWIYIIDVPKHDIYTHENSKSRNSQWSGNGWKWEKKKNYLLTNLPDRNYSNQRPEINNQDLAAK